jgi:hypothetical protein
MAFNQAQYLIRLETIAKNYSSLLANEGHWNASQAWQKMFEEFKAFVVDFADYIESNVRLEGQDSDGDTHENVRLKWI